MIKDYSMRTNMALENACVEQEKDSHIVTKGRYGLERTDVSVKNNSKNSMFMPGKYITVDCRSLTLRETRIRDYTAQVVATALQQLLNEIPVKETHSKTILVVGIGNRGMTADALGPKVVDNLIITRHIKDGLEKDFGNKMQSLAAVNTGVLGNTGIEAFDIIKGITDKIKPRCVIAVDSLATRLSQRISTSFQLTDTGIKPGGGVNEERIALSKKTLGVPVISIGVPLVVYASTLTLDILNAVHEKSPDLKPSKTQLNKLISNILIEDLSELVVTPKDIDVIVKDCAYILSIAINLAVHTGLNIDDVVSLMN